MNRIVRNVAVLAGLVAGVAATVSALWPDDPAGNIGLPAEPPYLTIFLVDGLNQRVFEELLAAGRLPNLARMVDEGAYVRSGVSPFPSMTGYAYSAFLTGEDAALTGPLGLRWLDRDRDENAFRAYVGRTYVLMNQDLHAEPKNLFEVFGEAHSFTLNSYNNRGAHRAMNTGWMFTTAKYREHWWVASLLSAIPFFRAELAPDWPEVESRVIDLAIEDLAHRPKVQWITFVSPDTYGHLEGLGPRYPELVVEVDALIGRYREASRAAGLEAERVYAVVSDHGVEDADRNIDLVKALGELGVRAERGQATQLLGSDDSTSWANLAQKDVLFAINGNMMNHVYVRDPGKLGVESWRSRPDPSLLRAFPKADGTTQDLLDAFLRLDALRLVMVRGVGTEVVVHAKDGLARIDAKDGEYSVRIEGRDPFGYAGSDASALLDGVFHSPEAWLTATAHTRYPYAPVRIHRLLSDPNAGDLLITAAEGYDLAADYELFVGNYRGGHGGLRSEQLLVPYLLSGPGVRPRAKIEIATAEDLGATLHRLLHAPYEDARAGRVLTAAIASEVAPAQESTEPAQTGGFWQACWYSGACARGE